MEVDVVERVILDVDREVILLGVGRDALGHRPGNKDAVLLEPEIPMQSARVMLLYDEPRRLGLLARDLGAWFRCLFEIAFGLVLGKLLGHRSRLGHGGFRLLQSHLQADPFGRDFAILESALSGEALEASRRV